MEQLHAPFRERLKVMVKIPCNCRICNESDKPHFYDKIDLDTRMEKGKMTVECSMSYDNVSVMGLLEGVFSKDSKILNLYIHTEHAEIMHFIKNSILSSKVFVVEKLYECDFIVLDQRFVDDGVLQTIKETNSRLIDKTITINDMEVNEDAIFFTDIVIDYSMDKLEELVESLHTWIILNFGA